ncbi:zonular occludens toxin domain-containing protein [Paraglaciecola marina]|uniref:zonular occludens toxin domain-containing protein n=1 Tax=Paraglaciecola marina TaxID=2500157 RepID=UPI00105DD809|nr:zonular occludens toxin domain-containing protein [Paraglaciecola marina]
MTVHLVTGKLGGGKSLCTVGKIRDYLAEGRMVATNLDLYVENFGNPWAKKTRIFRLPDKPTVDDFENLPAPYEGDYDESKTGLIVLDECGTWFNTREYRDKSRQPVINKMLHIRKAGWDVMFIIQHIEMIDKQVREGLGELVATCRRADRLRIPFFTPFFGMLGIPLRPPRIHVAEVRYGTHSTAPLNDRWVYRGNNLFNAYDTRQVFGSNDCGLHSMLPAYNVYGCTIKKWDYEKRRFKENTVKWLAAFGRAKRLTFLVGLISGGLFLPDDINFSITGLIFGTEEKTKVVTQPDSPKDKALKPEIKHINDLDSVYISASVKHSDGFDYVFYKNDEIYHPEDYGYKVNWSGPCKAKLIGLNDYHFITCSATVSEAARESETTKPNLPFTNIASLN